ncbi:unnamed protein product [Arctia plantaginis]|uniref:Uncharacterized protein n=1 Tax=Arctia plantaginis TaxID=874455 RepID=A0A8S1ARD9_ARCPL|nr:unnamed protein product [Arctia plantaginis]
MGMPLSEADLDEVSHIGSKRPTQPWLATRTGNNESLPLVVKLLRRQKRDEVVKAARSRRNVTSENITMTPAQKIYIYERLTKANQDLLREIRLRP